MNIAERQLAKVISHTWWMLLLRGLAAVLFGVLTWLQPAISLAALVLLFGAYALADGVLGVWTAVVKHREYDDWWVLLLWGLLGVGVGILTFLAPGITALVLLFYIASWAIASGVLQIVVAIRLRREVTGEWLLLLAGLASVVFGVLLMMQPAAGALTVVWMIGTYAIGFGALLVILSLKARTFGQQLATDGAR